MWEHRQYAGNNAEKGENVGCYFYGTNGTFHQAWQQGWTFYPASDRGKEQHKTRNSMRPTIRTSKNSSPTSSARSRRSGRSKCDIEIAHRSTNMSLLGMLSMKLGRSLKWDGDKEMVIGDDEANKLLSREYRKPWEYPT